MNENQKMAPVVSIGQWIVVLILTAIPFINLIMLLVWAFGGGNNPNRENYAKASLILMVAAIVLWFLFIAVVGTALLY